MANLADDRGDGEVKVECEDGAVGFSVAAGTRGGQLRESGAVDVETFEAILRINARDKEAGVLNRDDNGGDIVEGGGQVNDSHGTVGGRVLPFGAESQTRVGAIVTYEFVPENRRDLVEKERAKGCRSNDCVERAGNLVEQEFHGRRRPDRM